MRKLLFILCALLFSGLGIAQDYFPVNGAHDVRNTTYLFTNAVVQMSPQKQLSNASMRIQNGEVLEVGSNLAPRGGNEVVIDLKGKYIYPAFIELDSDYGLPEIPKKKPALQPQYATSVKGPYGWNEAIRSDLRAVEHVSIDAKKASALKQAGVGAVLTHQHDGIARGTGTLISLSETEIHKNILAPAPTAHFSLSKGSSKQQYPSSLMGVLALLRQTHYDASWYATQNDLDHVNLTLEAWNKQRDLPWFIEVKDALDIPRVVQLGAELNKTFVVRADNDAYRVAENLWKDSVRLVIPLTLPNALNVEDPYTAMYATLEDLKHWELAPANAALLNQAEIDFAFTLTGLKKPNDLFTALQKAVSKGLPREVALEALTTRPANWVGASNLGTLETGKRAHFFIASASVFSKEVQVLETWVGTERTVFEVPNAVSWKGSYNLNINGELKVLELQAKGKKLSGSLVQNGDTVSITGTVEESLVSFSYVNKKDEVIRFTGKTNFEGKIWDGRVKDASGNWQVWSAIRQDLEITDQKKQENTTIPKLPEPWFPNTAFGYDTLPVSKNYFINNVTVWTCDSAGKFVGDVVVIDGKIAQVGKDLAQTPDLIYINGKGMHLTPGIVDEHSHIAISRGVNEGTKASSAEVRIGDVINPTDINIYRQLAGGVTSAQLLHGSANPIGGQSAIIKLKWGRSAEEMKIPDAPGFIKFALGENVKQSNWGDNQRERFPQTRMGVEQVYYDYFLRARDYATSVGKADSEASKFRLFRRETPPLRRDLELEALAEILDSTRFISCHSYVQSEVNMLMHVADSMGFRVNTFTHILEGYKLADKMREHGVAGSTFADWWAYKFEVNDAIPYNAAILNEQGVLTGINSDDAEMGRRLNQETAKTVKYGGVSEEDALKMVTINPATMLHINHRTGSITPGKDADLVLWTGHPLSIYSKVQFTMIEGVKYFDRDEHERTLARMEKERNRLVKAMMDAKAKGEQTTTVVPFEHKLYHCDSEEDEGTF